LLGVDLVDLYADAAEADFGGFASIDVVSFRFSSPLDFTSVPDGAALFFVDITRRAARLRRQPRPRVRLRPGQEQVRLPEPADARQPHHRRARARPHLRRVDLDRGALGHRRDADARSRSDRDARRHRADRSDAGRAWNQYAKFRAYLTAESRPPSTVAAAAVFTVPTPARWRASSPPRSRRRRRRVITDLTLCDGVATSPCAPVGDTGRACGDSSGRVLGAARSADAIPNYQAGTLPYERPADGGAIAVDGSGAADPGKATCRCASR
jgi:hypothetical protein